MTPFLMPIPNEEGDQDQDLSHDNVLLNANNSPFPCTIFFNNLEDQGTNNASDMHHCQGQQELSHPLLSFQSNTVERSLGFGAMDEKPDARPDKWMSSKMRFMRKMMNSEQIILKRSRRGRRNTQALEDDQQLNQENSNNAQSGFIRFCSDCNTTKTPLWRSGPQGPKSLCNACGIRQRKARRAMAAAAGLISVDKAKDVGKLEKGSEVDHTMPFKKRCKFMNSSKQTEKKICLENVMISLSKNSGFSPPPQDERDAALLLMSLSCNLVIS